MSLVLSLNTGITGFRKAFVTLFPAMQAAMIFKEGTTLAKRLLGLGYIYGNTDLFS